MRILLVSGHPTVSEQVRRALLGRDHAEIVEVSTPQRALAMLEEGEPFDIVVGDNDTHPAGGIFLARGVRDLGRMGHAVPPVVLLLARSQDVWLANWAQADAWALKPPDPFDLAEAVDALVEHRPVPQLPGFGSDPTPSLLDVDHAQLEAAGKPASQLSAEDRVGVPGNPHAAQH